MARIIITLSTEDIGNLLLGGEFNITPSVQKFDNLTGVVLKTDSYNCTESEVDEYDD